MRSFNLAATQRLFPAQALLGRIFSDVFDDFHRARMKVSCAFGHNETRSTLLIERGVEDLNAAVIGIPSARQAEREAAARCHP